MMDLAVMRISATVMEETREVSFRRLMKELPRDGTATRAACGMTTWAIVWSLFSPRALHASNCPLGMEPKAARMTSEL